ncbi:MAG: hypothetical protein ABIH86_03080 [Planctomycetota bacterium]
MSVFRASLFAIAGLSLWLCLASCELKKVKRFEPKPARVVDAGSDQILVYPDCSASLVATYSGFDSPINISWTVVSGPCAALFNASESAVSNAMFDKPGVYRLAVSVNDGILPAVSDDIEITMAPGILPVIDAGPDLSITIPVQSTVMNATLNGFYGEPALSWTLVSGPGAVVFGQPSSETTTIFFPITGTYVLRLNADNGFHPTMSDTLTVMLCPPESPFVDAGADQSLEFPDHSTTLTGVVVGSGFPVSISWTVVSGPGTVSFDPSTSAAFVFVDFSSTGVYTLMLSADDGYPPPVSDTVVVTVCPNQPPVVDAGVNLLIRRPGLSIDLKATATDPEGDPLTVQWSQMSGPGVTVFSAAGSLSTIATFSLSGTYALEIEAIDGYNPGVSDTIVIQFIDPLYSVPSDGFTIILADLNCPDDLPRNGYSEPDNDAGISYRALLPGATQYIKLDAWWTADELRPDETKRYILEIQYRDDATEPAEYYAHGANGRYHGVSLLHHFGGAGDGLWKTAQLPLSWSSIIRLLDDRDHTRILFKSNQPIPIHSITLRIATDEDVERLNREIREWVEYVQTDERAAAALLPGEFFVEPSDMPLVAFPWEPLLPLLPNMSPTAGMIDQPIEIDMCLNELESGSFGVFAAGDDLTNVDYEISPLLSSSGVSLSATLILRTAEYSALKSGATYRLFPQRLWPHHPVSINQGYGHWFYIVVKTRRGATLPGVYSGTVQITCDQGFASLPINVTVRAVDLLTMSEAGLENGGCISGFVPPHDYRFAMDYNQNGMNIWFAGAQPKMTMVNGPLELDFTYLDDTMRYASNAGVESCVWFLGGDPYGWPDTMTIIRDLARIDNPDSATNMAVRLEWTERQASVEQRNAVVPELRDAFKSWVSQTAAQSRAQGWPEIILTPFDEPAKWVQGPYLINSSFPYVIGAGPWIKPVFEDMCALIREADSAVKIYGSIHHATSGIVFLDDIDVFCTNAIHEDVTLGTQVNAAGKTFWQYAGTGSGGLPGSAFKSFGWYFGYYNSRGGLVWAYNWGNWFDNTQGDNWTYVHHTAFDVIPEPYYEGLREAFDLRRIIETYKIKFGANPTRMAELNAMLLTAKNVNVKSAWSSDADVIEASNQMIQFREWRKTLLDRLEE